MSSSLLQAQSAGLTAMQAGRPLRVLLRQRSHGAQKAAQPQPRPQASLRPAAARLAAARRQMQSQFQA